MYFYYYFQKICTRFSRQWTQQTKYNFVHYIGVRTKTCVFCVAIDHILGKNNLILTSLFTRRCLG